MWRDCLREIQPVGLILAGGQGARMGGLDKGLVPYQGQSLVSRAIATLETVAGRILISANRHEALYRSYGLEVLSDGERDYLGPLAGIRAGMRAVPDRFIVTLPCDMPLAPCDMFHEMVEQMGRIQAPLLVAHDGMRLQSLLMLAHSSLHDSIDAYLNQGERRVEGWIRSVPHVIQDVSEWRPLLSNLNTREDLESSEGLGTDFSNPSA